MMKLSRQFIERVKLHDEPSHKLIARLDSPFQFHPTLLSKWIHKAQPVRPHDERVIGLGRLLGLTPQECFEVDASPEAEPARVASGDHPV
jgi:hypothetical protein